MHPAFIEARSQSAMASVLADIEDIRADRTDPMYRRLNPTPYRAITRKRIYFVQGECTGLIKIGTAVRFEDRFKAIQAMSPDNLHVLRVIPGDNTLEKSMHDAFSTERRHGEWFTPSTRLLSFVDAVTDLDVR